MDLDLQQKSVMVTGGSRGIGFASARLFCAEGVGSVHLVARDSKQLDRVRTEMHDAHPNVEIFSHAVDLSSEAAVCSLVEEVGLVDILVNCAGAIPRGTVEQIEDLAWRGAWDLKVFGYISVVRRMLPLMKEVQRGTILNVIGAGADILDVEYVAGCTGNVASVAFTKTVGSMSMDSGVRVLGVNPGPVETDRLIEQLKTRAQNHLGNASQWRDYLSMWPGHRAATAAELADVIVFLASPRSSYVSGTVVTVDGGMGSRHAQCPFCAP